MKYVKLGVPLYILVPVWKSVKVIDKPAFLKDKFAFIRFLLCYHNTSMFTFNFLGIVYMYRWRIFKNHGLQSIKVYNLRGIQFKITPFNLHLYVRLPVEGQITENA
jgi:hypothetical protein